MELNAEEKGTETNIDHKCGLPKFESKELAASQG